MMAFRIARGGYRAMATPDECELICGLIHDVVYILGTDVDAELARAREREEFLARNGLNTDVAQSLNPAELESDSQSAQAIESDLFAALEDEFAAIEELVEDEQNPDVFPLDNAPAQQDDALVRLLPDMSEDPNDATELRKLTEESIALAKVDNLLQMYQALRAIIDDSAAGNAGFGSRYDQSIREPGVRYPGDGVPASRNSLLQKHRDIFVANDAAPHWLAAMNDIRLVLATRLEIDDEQTNESVYERSQLFTSHSMLHDEQIPEIESPEDMMTVLYAMLSWWQESLVGAVRNKALRR